MAQPYISFKFFKKYKMKCIVTGGCGFIGSNLVERLVEEGYDVMVFDDLSLGTLKNIEGPRRNLSARYLMLELA